MTQTRAAAAEVETGGWYTYHFTARSDVRCGLSGCRVRHPVVYVGKTNEPWRRHWEHLKDKDWAPLTSGYQIHETVYATEAEALAAERAMIRDWQPLANDVHNRDNPHRLVFAKAEPLRVGRRPSVSPQFSRRIPSPVRRDWTRRQKQAGAVAAVWLVLAGAGWWAVCRWLPVGLADGALDGAVAASTLLVLAGALSVRTRGRGAGWGRFWRAVGLCAAAAGGVFLLWQLGPSIMPAKIG